MCIFVIQTFLLGSKDWFLSKDPNIYYSYDVLHTENML